MLDTGTKLSGRKTLTWKAWSQPGPRTVHGNVLTPLRSLNRGLPPWPDTVHWDASPACQACRSRADKVSRTWMEATFLCRLDHLNFWFSPCSFLELGSIQIISSIYITVLAFASGPLHPAWPDSRQLRLMPCPETPVRTGIQPLGPICLIACHSPQMGNKDRVVPYQCVTSTSQRQGEVFSECWLDKRRMDQWTIEGWPCGF